MFLPVTSLQRCKTTLPGGFPATGGRHLSFLITKVRSRSYLHCLGLDWSLLRSVCSWGYPGPAGLSYRMALPAPMGLPAPGPCTTVLSWPQISPVSEFPVLDRNWKVKLLILLQDGSVPAELGTALRQVGEETPQQDHLQCQHACKTTSCQSPRVWD